MQNHGGFCQKVQNYAKAPFMNLNNAKAASFYAKTCKTPNVLIQITQKHTLLMQNPAKVAIVLIRNVQIMQKQCKIMQKHIVFDCRTSSFFDKSAKLCKSTVNEPK